MRTTDLAQLTGLRSGKPTFYPQYRGASARLERVVAALELISRALVRTVEGPETLICAVAEAARAHLSARWVIFALADGALPDTGLRRLVLGPDATPFLVGDMEGPPLPAEVVELLDDLRTGAVADELIEPNHVVVPIHLDGGTVGAFAAWTPASRTVDATDQTVLTILASQTAVALQNSSLFQHARRTAADLASRNLELESTQRELDAAGRRHVLDRERHRIARELHDSVTQTVLSAGMQVEVLRRQITEEEWHDRLDLAKDLTRTAVEQLRAAIYALEHSADDNRSSLPEMLRQLAVAHKPDDLSVTFEVNGTPVDLPAGADHGLLRIAGEALFNTAAHSGGSSAVLRLTYRSDHVVLTVDDDGDGDPARLRKLLRMGDRVDSGGHHRGLCNMATRSRELGGGLEIRRSRLGGVRIRVRIPLAAEAADGGGGEQPQAVSTTPAPTHATVPATVAGAATAPSAPGFAGRVDEGSAPREHVSSGRRQR